MSALAPRRVLVLGGGPAGQAAMAALPGASLIARPLVTAWHAEPGRLWLEGGARVWAETFDALLVCADEPLLLAALGCAVSDGRIVVDREGRTSVPGIYAAGRVAGAATAEEAAVQARIAAQTLRAGFSDPAPRALPAEADAGSASRSASEQGLGAALDGNAIGHGSNAGPLPDVAARRLDPQEIAMLLERPAGPCRNAAALAQCALLGPILPARPVGLVALASLIDHAPSPLPPQSDEGRLA